MKKVRKEEEVVTPALSLSLFLSPSTSVKKKETRERGERKREEGVGRSTPSVSLLSL